MSNSTAPTNPIDSLFEPPEARGRWWQRRSTIAGAAVVLVVGLVAAFATGALGSSGSVYRTSVVTERAVDRELTGVATIEPVSQATVGFPRSGTVTSVAVQVGDQVAAGDTLAQLDTKDLEQQLHTAEAALAEAELTLQNGLNGQRSTTPGGSSSGTTARNVSATATTSDVRIVFTAATSDPELAAAQQAVLQAQQQVDAALTEASSAYDNAVAVCTAAEPDADACRAALQTSLDAQKDVQTAQHQLVEAAIAYDDLLTQRASQGGGSTPGGGGAGPAPDATPDEAAPDRGAVPQGGTGPSSGLSGGSTAAAPTSADLIAYQKAVDAAAANVAAAHQAIEQARITTPIAGTVVAVDLRVGETASDASTQNVVIEGDGGMEATTVVTVDEVATIQVGQRAFVAPDGTKQVLRGSVAATSVAPISSGSSNYRVTVALDDPTVALHNGSTGTVSIITDQSDTGLAVPTSAISSAGGRHLVTVVDGAEARQVVVEVGVVGREWTSITSGLSAGDEVVLANLDEPLPSSATESSDGGGFTFPRGGGPPGLGARPGA